METLPWKYKALIGGAGALAPSIVTLAYMDFRSTLQSADWLTYLGVIVRITVLFAIGAAVAAFHTSENAPWKLFELGIGAPALITTALVGGQVGRQASIPLLNPAAAYAAGLQLAQTASKPSGVDQFLRGVFGGPGPQYVVIAFPETRGVRVDGVEVGKTNEVLMLKAGVHTVTLAPPPDFLPVELKIYVERTTAGNPMRVTFAKRQ